MASKEEEERVNAYAERFIKARDTQISMGHVLAYNGAGKFKRSGLGMSTGKVAGLLQRRGGSRLIRY
jgi:hypothetical protein